MRLSPSSLPLPTSAAVSTSLLLLRPTLPMQITRTWTTKHWCESVIRPEWPFAYSKYAGQTEETKGRTSTNLQDVRHVCGARGVRSKCHICEDIACGDGDDQTCHFQLQGVRWDEMSANIPTVSDVPWAVGGSHRYDFGSRNSTHVCVYTSSQFPCGSSFGTDYSGCNVRCWGHKDGLSGRDNAAGAATSVYDGPTGVWPNHRKDNTLGVNATPWTLPGPTAAWSYPKHALGDWPRNPFVEGVLTSLPQGFTFTLAGGGPNGGEEGFVDGDRKDARFRLPEGVAVDRDGYLYVTDTGNHAIRMVSPRGSVTTLAGTGVAGSRDGYTADAMFASPSGVAVWEGPGGPNGNNASGAIVLFVADTANHRIRKITGTVGMNETTGEKVWSDVLVECHSGRCGSAIDPEYMPQDAPHSGFADGPKEQARFDAPKGLSVSSGGVLYVADTNNHIIREVDPDGMTRTLAGSFVIAETNHREGCPPPCLAGVQGSLDGALGESQFSFPSDVAVAHGDVFVTDRNHLRKIDLVAGQVITLAGGEHEGERDGQGPEASFHKPDAVAATSDGYIYVADASSCRIRRASPADVLASPALCSDTLASLLRPSGCSAYDPPTDEYGLRATPVSGDTYYNYRHRNEYDFKLGRDYVGRGVKDCVGSPPPQTLDKRMWNDTQEAYPFNWNLVVDDQIAHTRQDPNEGTVIKVQCPAGCNDTSSGRIYGGILDPPLKLDGPEVMGLFSEQSSVCAAALHSGVVTEGSGGLVDITIHREMDSSVLDLLHNSTKNGIKPRPVPRDASRLFSVSPSSAADVAVQTIAGAPAVPLGDTCGNHDAIPPQEALFGTPTGIAAFVNATLDDASAFLYIADRNNHAIRAISATCSFPCENGGRCIGPNTCRCERGWTGIDCSRPVCSSPCGEREVCVGPDLCKCIPGYGGPGCAQPTCVQICENGAACVAPDTCGCMPGWFDPNCTTPVCEQTCGNGGNCTGPDLCSCPTDWTGPDCRTPVCEQDCTNGGLCVAPNTCMCPPQWSGFDCGVPICHQGLFVAGMAPPIESGLERLGQWLQYLPCNATEWCESTGGFDCAQADKVSNLTLPYFGEEWRFKTGRRDRPAACMQLEIGPDVLSPFQYLSGIDNASTSHHRYSPKTPHDNVSKDRLPWNAITKPQDGFTQPWTYQIDRQVALAELHNVTQGAYACANGGRCIAPDVCACAQGWIGFDCRVPVCDQGYYEPDQEVFVRGTNLEGELAAFERFMGTNTYRLDPLEGYSNPEVTIVEEILNVTTLERRLQKSGGRQYMQVSGYAQGGYSCAIRSVTQWEDYRTGFLLDHPNYYSRYMDHKVEDDGIQYTHWDGMKWPPTHMKSKKLEIRSSDLSPYGDPNHLFLFTDQGHRRDGDWTVTGSPWKKGSCVVEFHRVCDGDPTKPRDLEAGLSVTEHNLLVQDTDKAFRPRVSYNDERMYSIGAWREKGGECVDHVIRGCFNNGTCISPNECLCAQGWKGHDCTVPICSQACLHNGNCSLPDTCTCEKGWTGHDCSIAVCAQECQNGGECVAPDTCRCKQWENEWRDGRAEGGVPLYQKPNGDPQMTGWTGYDCSTPICVQAERFLLNVDMNSFGEKNLVYLGGHGKDGTLECDTVRCPEYNKMVTLNDGRSFQSGCGFDPLETGCCHEFDPGEGAPLAYICFSCREGYLHVRRHSMSCPEIQSLEFASMKDVPLEFILEGPGDGRPKYCGKWHNPNQYYTSTRPNARPEFSSRNKNANFTSDRFLCKRHTWEQGDFIDSAGLDGEVGIGGDLGLAPGRHIRINFNNYLRDEGDPYNWTSGPSIPGEGIFECHNGGSCIAPDICTCQDGYAGFDCRTPLCRHQQTSGTVVGCLNGGSCQSKDDCHCIQTLSVLWRVHGHAERGLTGWTGTDCSIPICVQGYYDPFCDGSFALGGEGCYRCANGGTCVAPDTCLCAEGWEGFDCRTPICEAVATPLIRKQLMTVDEEKVRIFENDPCGMVGFYKPDVHNGVNYARGNCTLPNMCTCLCKGTYDVPLCQEYGGVYCKSPFQDPLFKLRNVLAPNEIFGTRTCYSGFEGIVDSRDNFQSCHLTIYEPGFIARNSVALVVWGSILLIFGCCTYTRIRRKLHQQFLLAKIERRKPGQIAEYSGGGKNAFMHKNVKTM